MNTDVADAEINEYKEIISDWLTEYSNLINELPISRKFQYADVEYLLGEGSYGIVKLAKRTSDGEFVVLKIFKNPVNKYTAFTVRELCFLNELKHPNVVSMLEIYCQKGMLCTLNTFLSG